MFVLMIFLYFSQSLQTFSHGRFNDSYSQIAEPQSTV